MATVGIIDYGMGNLYSMSKALNYVASDEQIIISYDPDDLVQMDRLVLPGVGAIAHCMDELQRLELDHMLQEFVTQKPLLGVCLGMQALMSHSQENGGVSGLNLFSGRAVHFAGALNKAGIARHKTPHMGWNRVHPKRNHPLWKNITPDSWFYFVHSYFTEPDCSDDILGETHYGLDFASMLLQKNILAVQFHPEKSQAAGLQLLANFLEWNGQA